uniref:LEAF RUST 10 DISEASE-RESISTANCE LOCUS RECEPTOR-LIKE PROTEIN KINASE-like 1.4 isoform X1 n=1 Tax=Erigeron canadensis TaxID=72917 RepID=UPI001CB8A259|nr:LEAF RUST 10 DISEASE-RESISTANCE LOCUS RECEPTOR-LIKE PROTEIN KINASE-like 1.4 isoform X1 [Erigeron canadensis]
MKPHHHPSHTALFAITVIILASMLRFQSVWCQADAQPYEDCDKEIECGNVKLEYPFWGLDRPAHCGHLGFQVTCQSDVPILVHQSVNYRVLNADSTTKRVTVARNDLWDTLCPQYLYNTTYDTSLFNENNFRQENVSLFYGCNTRLPGPSETGFRFPCIVNQTESENYFIKTSSIIPALLDMLVQCNSSITVPVNESSADRLGLGTATTDDLKEALKAGFNLGWTANNNECDQCLQTQGRCGSNVTSPELFACHCSSGSFSRTCNNRSASEGSSKNNSLTIVLPIVGVVIACIVLGCGILVCRRRRKRREMKEASPSAQNETKAILTKVSSSKFDSSIPSYPTSKTLKISTEYTKSSYFGAQVFSYEELEVATDNFNDSRELGDGGFGTVYYGKLLDGREVAVKRLYENNFKRVEQFMNEVQILSKLEHENLVKLYGCTSKRSKELVLVYEYIPNGTVADHLHGKLANSGSDLFSWSVRLNIAIETAEALAYLHKSDIIHRDVKTNNILLDKSFKVKVADFGLSRLFPDNATHVSTAPQGTPGYVDPEYYQCYHLTDKSDVYSFGVVLIELISSLQAVDTNRHRHDINLANMAVTKIQNHSLDELVDKSIGFETNGLVRRMTTLVAELAFRCLQQEKDMRPTMKEVVEILRGIQDDQLNAQKPEVLDIVVDDGGLSNDHSTQPSSSDSGVTNKQVGSSAPNSSDG